MSNGKATGHDAEVADQAASAGSATPERDKPKVEKPKGGKPPSLSDYDPFVLEKIFPDLEAILVIPPSTDETAKNCIFLLDANSLLAPFEVSQDSLKDLSEIYRRLAREGRLFTAARALREYAKHRADKIKNVYYKLTEMGKRSQPLEALKLPLLEGSKAYQELQEARTAANATLLEYDRKRQQLADEVRAWNRNDDVSKLYADVFKLGSTNSWKTSNGAPCTESRQVFTTTISLIWESETWTSGMPS